MAFGKFGTYKRVEILIEAVEMIRKRTQEDIEVVIAGTDSPNTPGYLAEMAVKYAHVTNLRFTGYVAEEDVPVIFSESAVVVFPYTSTTGSSGVLTSGRKLREGCSIARPWRSWNIGKRRRIYR